jgi:ribosomal-protein-alanine N-acetyltransferase
VDSVKNDLKEFMQMNIIETDRLIICRLSEGDSEFILELLNSPGWLKFIGNKNVKTEADAENYIINGPIKSYEVNGFGLYLVKLKKIYTPVGICGLIKRDTLENIDIGFALLPEYEGNGYAFEAAEAVLKHAKRDLGIKKIVAITDKDNVNSIRLLEKAGLIFEKNILLKEDDKELMLFSALL